MLMSKNTNTKQKKLSSFFSSRRTSASASSSQFVSVKKRGGGNQTEYDISETNFYSSKRKRLITSTVAAFATKDPTVNIARAIKPTSINLALSSPSPSKPRSKFNKFNNDNCYGSGDNKHKSGFQQCVICNKSFPRHKLMQHASDCNGSSSSPISSTRKKTRTTNKPYYDINNDKSINTRNDSNSTYCTSTFTSNNDTNGSPHIDADENDTDDAHTLHHHKIDNETSEIVNESTVFSKSSCSISSSSNVAIVEENKVINNPNCEHTSFYST
jgi:hypothetical protein